MHYLIVVLAAAAVVVGAGARGGAGRAPDAVGRARPAGGLGLPHPHPDGAARRDRGEGRTYTEEEAAAFEARRLAEFAAMDEEEPADIVGNYNQFWFDRGDTVVQTNRTSLVTDPADGRIPALTGAAAARAGGAGEGA